MDNVRIMLQYSLIDRLITSLILCTVIVKYHVSIVLSGAWYQRVF